MVEVESSISPDKAKKKGILGLAASVVEKVSRGDKEPPAESTKQKAKRKLSEKTENENVGQRVPEIGIKASEDAVVPKSEADVIVEVVNQKLDAVATRDHNKPYKDLSSADKLAVLSEVARVSGNETTSALKGALSDMSKELKEHSPSPEQWNRLRDRFQEIPKEARVYGADPETKMLLEKAKATVFKRVGDNLEEYGFDEYGLNDVAQNLEYTAWGAIPRRLSFAVGRYHERDFRNMVEHFNNSMGVVESVGDETRATDLLKDLINDVNNKLKRRGLAPAYISEGNILLKGALQRIQNLEKHTWEANQYARSLEGVLSKVTTESKFSAIVDNEAGGGRLSSHEMDVIEAKYQVLGGAGPNVEKEAFRLHIARTVHVMVEGLERNELESWRIGGINPVEYQVDQYIRILERVDHAAGEKLRVETMGRQWMHRMVHELRTSAEPSQELLRESQQLEDVDFYKEIIAQPGMSRSYQLIERRSQDLIRAETVQGGRDRILGEIVAELNSPANPELQLMKDAGISAETAVRLADRFYFSTGRDGMAYAEFLQRNNLIQYKKNPDGYMVGIIKPEAPIFWNFFRLLYSPDAQITFFQIGSKATPDTIKFWKDGRAEVESVGGRGVGAIVMATMRENHYGLDVRDFVSRRHDGYLVRAWGLRLFDHTHPGPLVVPEVGMTTNPGVAANADEMHRIYYGKTSELGPEVLSPGQQEFRELQSKYIHAKVGKSFAEKFGGVGNPDARDKNHNPIGAVGTVKWEGLKKPEWENQVKVAKNAIRNDHTPGLTPAQKHAMLDKIDELNRLYTDHGGLLDQQKDYNNIVKTLTAIENSDYLDLSNANISELPFDVIPRLEENIRGNFRDHVGAWTVFNKIKSFVGDSTVENWAAITHKDSVVYTTPSNFQAHVMLPATQALIKVQRGKLPGGYDIFGVKQTMSEYGKIHFTKALSDATLHKLMLQKVTVGDLDIEEVRELEGKFNFSFREIMRHVDPMLALTVLFAAVQSELQKLQKEAEKN